MTKKKGPLPVKKMIDFHKELTSLLNRYELHGDVDHLELKTSAISFTAHGLSNCDPKCVVYGPYIGPDGKPTVGYYCTC